MAYFPTDCFFKPSSISDTLYFPDHDFTNCISEINNIDANQFGAQDLVVDFPDNDNRLIGGTSIVRRNGEPFLFSHPSYSESSSGTSSAPIPYLLPGKSQESGIGKRKRGKQKGGDHKGAKEVVHVRAKRGQATDSHSLAERVRRGKINERLRCLQDIVPGCYKTMGMAVMLDEIINYVRSLQNQVEFLSMKLAAASTYYDFNSESDAVEAMQRAQAFGEQGNGGGHPLPQSCSSPTTWNS
ncbi:hypothetical protein MLD38_030120 [Melastoma candidum]|uniref:Uncharacterized protein n=1 Tax=Melastoma candidum TaxID=119954 RepID=A0ACB9MKV3_9MYRT|nr:hypothetical protein MLD38_030120 [Melastoma candidum]